VKWPILAVSLLATFTALSPPHCDALSLRLLETIGPDLSSARLVGPFGVSTAASGDILVSDDLGNRVYHFGESRTLVRALGEQLGFSYTDAALLVPTGYIVADTGRHRLLFLSAGGKVERSITRLGWFSKLANPRSVSRNADGSLLVADWGNNRAVRLSPDGTLITRYSGELNGPIDAIEVPSLGVVVSDHRNDRLRVFPADGSPARTIGGPGRGLGQLNRPCGLALGPKGFLWVADSRNARLSVFAPSGAPHATISGAPGTRLSRPTDLAFDRDGRIWVSDAGQHKVYLFEVDP